MEKNNLPEDISKELFTIIPLKVHKRLKSKAALLDVSIKNMVTNALTYYLDILDEEEKNKNKELKSKTLISE